MIAAGGTGEAVRERPGEGRGDEDRRDLGDASCPVWRCDLPRRLLPGPWTDGGSLKHAFVLKELSG